jgi:hypothetical protein
VLRGGLASEEVAARAINAEPWEPLPGMTKEQCSELPQRCSAPTVRQRGRGRRCDRQKYPGQWLRLPRGI